MSDTSLVEIKSLEKEVQLLLTQYESVEKQINTDIENKVSFSSIQKNVQLAKEINDKLLTLLSIIKNKINIIYPKGITNQNVVRMNNPNLNKIANKLNKDQSKLQQLINEYNSLDGKNNVLTLQLNSFYYEYLFYFVIVIILLIYTFKFYGQYEIVDMVIVICGIVLLLYHFIGNFIQYSMDGIKYIIRKFIATLYLL